MHDMRAFMLQASEEISAEYRRIYATAAQDPGTAGDEGEENWANLFRDWLPSHYHVETKGRLLSSDGRLSPQVDVVVLEPGYPKKLREKRKWFAGGVVAAFECKTTLNASHVTSAVERCVRFKELYEPREGSPQRELTSQLIYGLLAHSHSWKAPNSNPIKNIENAHLLASGNVDHPRNLIDLLCVADLATWATAYQSYMLARNLDAHWEEKFTAAFGGPLGVTTTLHRYDQELQNGDIGFTPLGELIGQISRRMAWHDRSLRNYSAYTSIAGGNGTGFMRPWSLEVYSAPTLQRVANGEVTNGWPGEDRWAGWAMIGP